MYNTLYRILINFIGSSNAINQSICHLLVSFFVVAFFAFIFVVFRYILEAIND